MTSYIMKINYQFFCVKICKAINKNNYSMTYYVNIIHYSFMYWESLLYIKFKKKKKKININNSDLYNLIH